MKDGLLHLSHVLFLCAALCFGGEPRLVADLVPGTDADGDTTLVAQTVWGDLRFLVLAPAADDTQVWVTDGTSAGTRLLLDTGLRATAVTFHVVAPEYLLFSIYDNLYRTDGTTGGTWFMGRLPLHHVVFGERLVTSDATALDIWDGAHRGPQRLLTGIVNTVFAASSTRAYFFNESYHQLGYTDGTAAGTGFHDSELFYDQPALIGDSLPDGTDLFLNGGQLIAVGPDGRPRALVSASHVYSVSESVGDRKLLVVSQNSYRRLVITDGSHAGTRTVARDPDQPYLSLLGRGPSGFLLMRYSFSSYQPMLWDGGPDDPRPLTPSFTTHLRGTLHSGSLGDFLVADAGEGYVLWFLPPGASVLEPVPVGTDPMLLGLDALGRAVLTAEDGSGTRRLLVSDGTAAGTAVRADIGDRGLNWFRDLGDHMLFHLTDAGERHEIWGGDTTAHGTVHLRDGAPFEAFGDRHLFLDGETLFVSDGTPAGTVPLTDPSAGSGALPASTRGTADYLVFPHTDAVTGTEPWVTDGTPGGTHLLKNTRPALPRGNTFGTPERFAGKWVGLVPRSAGLADVVVSDGTPWGTVLAAQVPHGKLITASDAAVFWDAFDGDVRLVADDGVTVRTETLPDAIRVLRAVGERVFFVDQVDRLQRMDLGGSATFLSNNVIRQVPPVLLGPNLLFAAGASTDHDLWQSDGTGTTKLIDGLAFQSLTPVDDQVFMGAKESANVFSPWLTDGTVAGTRRVRAIGSMEPFAYVGFAAFAGKVYFSVHGYDLWVSDRTEAGTYQVADLRGGGLLAKIEGIYSLGHALLLLADTGGTTELWRSGGSAATTYRLATFSAVIDGADAAVSGGVLYFAGSTVDTGLEPWRSDGTGPGTYPLDDLRPGPESSAPRHFTAIGARLFFDADHAEVGRELFSLCSAPDTAVSAPDGLCGPESGLTASVPDAGAGAVYAWTIDGGVVTADDGAVITFDALGDTAVTLRVTVTLPEGCTASGEAYVPLVNAPPPPLAGIAGPDEVCGGAREVAFETDDLGPGFTYLWTVPEGAAIVTGAGTPRIAVDFATGIGEVSVVVANACGASAAAERTVVHLTPAATAEAGTDRVVCGTRLDLDAQGAPGSGTWAVVEGPGGRFVDSHDPRTAFEGLVGEAYLLRWTREGGPCAAAYDFVRVQFTQPPTVRLTGAGAACPGLLTDTAEVADAGPEAAYLWTLEGAELVDGQGTSRVHWRATSDTVVLRLRVQTGEGCTVETSAVIPATARMPAAWWRDAGAAHPDWDADASGRIDIRDYLHALQACQAP